jgi:hypothetical protein
LDPAAPRPPWAEGVGIVSITRTSEELSVLCAQERIPSTERCERGWRCLQVVGPLPFDAIGVLASLAGPLAEAGIPILAASSYETDFVFVKDQNLQSALDALRRAGHKIVEARS